MEVDCVLSATSNITPYNISPTNDANHTGLLSTSLSSNDLSVFSGLQSSVRASKKYAFQMGCIFQFNPNPL